MVIRWGEGVNIREPCRKGHSISAPPTGVVLMGAAQTHLIMLSVSPLDARGREDGSLGKDAICGNCADVPLCSDTILTSGFLCADSCTRSEWDKQDDAQSKIIRHKCMILWSIMLSAKFWFCNHSSSQWHEHTGQAASILFSDFQYLFAHRLVKGIIYYRHSSSFHCHKLNLKPFSSWFKELGCISPDMWRSTHCHSPPRRTLTTALAARRFMVIDSMW